MKIKMRMMRKRIGHERLDSRPEQR